MEQQTGSKSDKKYVNSIYCHSSYLAYMQSIKYTNIIFRFRDLYGRGFPGGSDGKESAGNTEDPGLTSG